MSNRWRSVLYSGDPRGTDLREALSWAVDIRSRLSHIRGELEDIGRIESVMPHDSRANMVAGSLTMALITLYDLVDGHRSFKERAERSDELWADVAADPDAYDIREGESWKWRPWGIFKRPTKEEQ